MSKLFVQVERVEDLIGRVDDYFTQPKKQNHATNADRIRAMRDEELAEFIAYSTSCETCVVRKGGSDECHNTNCSTAWLDWLKEEAKP